MYPNPQDVLPLPPRPDLQQYKKQAKQLSKACKARGQDGVREWAAQWMAAAGDRFVEFAWDRLSSSGKCALSDAQFVIARAYGFLSWPKFARHIDDLERANVTVGAFEAAADAIVAGDLATLKELLRDDPSLVHARSTREHRSTLLHYVAANGVENYRQKTPPNAVQIAETLLNAGAGVDAVADMYGGNATTLGLAATSIHPLRAGVQNALIDVLLERGAQLDWPSGAGRNVSIVTGCLANGRGEAAEHLALRGAVLDLESASGVGRLDVVRRFLQHRWNPETVCDRNADARRLHMGVRIRANGRRGISARARDGYHCKAAEPWQHRTALGIVRRAREHGAAAVESARASRPDRRFVRWDAAELGAACLGQRASRLTRSLLPCRRAAGSSRCDRGAGMAPASRNSG